MVRLQRTINLNVCATCQLRIRTGEDWFPFPKLYTRMILLPWGDGMLLPQMHLFSSPAPVMAIKSPNGWFERRKKRKSTTGL
jgi:hypothetical protein